MHANAKLTPAGRLVLVRRIASGRPLAHVAAAMGVSRTTAARQVLPPVTREQRTPCDHQYRVATTVRVVQDCQFSNAIR